MSTSERITLISLVSPFIIGEKEKKGKEPVFHVTPKEDSIKDFRLKIKEKTRKNLDPKSKKNGLNG